MSAVLKMPIRWKVKDADNRATRDGAPHGRERRMFPRKECGTRVEGRRLDHSIPARQQPQLSLALRDLSVGGLSAMTLTPVGIGERVAVYFPPQGAYRGWDVCGRVLRCEPSALGYRVAVAFDAMPMAA